MINPIYESLNDVPPAPRSRIYLPGLSGAGLRSSCPHDHESLFPSQSSLLSAPFPCNEEDEDDDDEEEEDDEDTNASLASSSTSSLTSKEENMYDVPRAIHAPALYFGASSSHYGSNLLCLSAKSLCLGASPPYVSSESSFSAGSLCCGASSPRPGTSRLVGTSPSLSSGSSSVSLSSSYLSASSTYSNEREIYDLASNALRAREERAEDTTPLICSQWANPLGGLYDVPSAIRYRCTFPLELQKFCQDLPDPGAEYVRHGVLVKDARERGQSSGTKQDALDAKKGSKFARERNDARNNEENKEALAEQMSGMSRETGTGERSDETPLISPRYKRCTSTTEGGLYDIPRLIHAASETAGDEPKRSPRSKDDTMNTYASKECPAMASGVGDFSRGKLGVEETYDVPRNLRRNLTFTSRSEGKLSETLRSQSLPATALSGLVVEDPEPECAKSPRLPSFSEEREDASEEKKSDPPATPAPPNLPQRPLTPPPKFNFTEPVSRYDVLEKASGLPAVFTSSRRSAWRHGGNGIYYTLQVKGKGQKVLDGLSDDSSDMGDSEGVDEDCMSSLFRTKKDAAKRLCETGGGGREEGPAKVDHHGADLGRPRSRLTRQAEHVVTSEPSGVMSTWSDQDHHGLSDADHYSGQEASLTDSGVGSGPEISLGSESLVLNPSWCLGQYLRKHRPAHLLPVTSSVFQVRLSVLSDSRQAQSPRHEVVNIGAVWLKELLLYFS